MPAGRKTFRFNPAARADLRNGVLWYEERRDGLGERFAAHVRAAIDLIVQGPERWPVRRGTHRYVFRSFPYTLAYRIAGDEVVIVAVAHHPARSGRLGDAAVLRNRVAVNVDEVARDAPEPRPDVSASPAVAASHLLELPRRRLDDRQARTPNPPPTSTPAGLVLY